MRQMRGFVKRFQNMRRDHVLLLAFSWILGFVFGMLYAHAAGDIVSALMRTAVCSRVSIVGLLASVFFPLIISAIAAYFSVPAVFISVAFLRAFSYGFCLWGVSAAYGSAGWLIRLLLLFSDSCTAVSLLWFCVRHLSGDRNSLKKDFVVCTVMASFVCCVDYFFVSPFLAALMS